MNPFRIEYPRTPDTRPLSDSDRNILAELADEWRDEPDDDPSPYSGTYSSE